MLAAHSAHLQAVACNAPLTQLVTALRELKPPDELGCATSAGAAATGTKTKRGA